MLIGVRALRIARRTTHTGAPPQHHFAGKEVWPSQVQPYVISAERVHSQFVKSDGSADADAKKAFCENLQYVGFLA